MRARATFVRRSLVFLRMKNKRTNGGRARTYVYVYIIRPKVVPELSTRRVGDHILPFPGRPTRVLRTVRATSVKTYADPNVPPSRLYGVIQLVRVFVIRCRLSKCRWRSTTTVWWRGGGATRAVGNALFRRQPSRHATAPDDPWRSRTYFRGRDVFFSLELLACLAIKRVLTGQSFPIAQNRIFKIYRPLSRIHPIPRYIWGFINFPLYPPLKSNSTLSILKQR